MKILIVDDSALIRNILKSVFSETDGFELAGEASNGEQGAAMVKVLKPDLVLMDINMPVLNGLEATKRIMKECPVPICIFSNEVDSDLTVKAMGYGAVDAVRKPDIDKMNEPVFLKQFIERLKGISRAHLSKQRSINIRQTASSPGIYRAVVVGASTGGPITLKEMLGRIPATFPLGIALVQHIEDRFDKSFATWLDTQTSLSVKLAKGGEAFTPGTVWVAPGNMHLVVKEGLLELEDSPKIINQKPAVDRLFVTAGEWFQKSLISVLLTGMGSDGADGCVYVKNKGGHTIVQDESTSTIFGMPKAAIEKGGAVKIMPLPEISDYLIHIAGKK